MRRPRDSYRRRVYLAERCLGPQDSEMTLEEAKRYIEEVLLSRWAIQRNHTRRLPSEVRDGRGTRTAWANRHTISLPKWSRSKRVILHELAHYLLCQRVDAREHPFHGRRFCGMFLAMVGRFLGSEAAKALRAEYVRLGVPYRSKKRLSPETIAKLRERGRTLAASRRPRG